MNESAILHFCEQSEQPDKGELEGELVNPLEEDIDEILMSEQPLSKVQATKIAAELWDRTHKPKTHKQLLAARKGAEVLVQYIDECIKELDKPNFEEPLDQQFKRIFGFKLPSKPMTKELFRKDSGVRNQRRLFPNPNISL
ncbi:MAG: hypothetical protein AAF378_22135 [Cyanobacteria bacterium P01_A01_bin.84]